MFLNIFFLVKAPSDQGLFIMQTGKPRGYVTLPRTQVIKGRAEMANVDQRL